MFTTNLQIHIGTCFIHLCIHHMSKFYTYFPKFLRLCSLGSVDSYFSRKSEAMCQFFDKHGYPVPVVQVGRHSAQQIDWQHYKLFRRKTLIAFNSLPHFTLKTTQLNLSFRKSLSFFSSSKQLRDWYYLFATSTYLIQTQQKHWELFGQKFISNQWPT